MSEESNHVFDQILKDPKIAGIVRDARLFDGLRTNEAWKRLHQLVEAKEDRWQGAILKRLMGPKKQWPTTEEIAFNQGFYYGAQFVLRHPEYAEQSLERAATMAWAMLQAESEDEA